MSGRHEHASSSGRGAAGTASVAGAGSPPHADLVGVLDRIEGLPALPDFVTRILVGFNF